jgi:hypothetical protein
VLSHITRTGDRILRFNNDMIISKENPDKISKNIPAPVSPFYHESNVKSPGLDPRFRTGKPAPSRLSNGTALLDVLSVPYCICSPPNTQGVPGGKVNILGHHRIDHSKQKPVYVHVSYSERFPR